MAYSHYVRCPRCAQISAVENRTPLWLLALGRANVRLSCPHCGFKKSYFFMSANKFEALPFSSITGCVTSGIGPKRRCGNVCFFTAYDGKAEVPATFIRRCF